MLTRRYKSPVVAYENAMKLALANVPFRIRISRHKQRGIEYVLIIYPVAAAA